AGVFTAPHNHDYYGSDGSNYGTRVRQLVRAMVDSAEAAGFDWSQFDNDGDGDVDGVTLVHSGAGAEQGDGSNIWSHRWSMGSNAVYYDGVYINDYSINPEIQGNNIVAIGVLAHEFGHVLGLPDLYDTDYSSAGSGKLALMGSGAWGTSGNTPWYPSAMNAWCKTEMGWSNVQTLSTDQSNINLEQSFTNNLIYRVNHPNDNSEYWLIENRQKRGTDNLMPSPGLLFWHIDTEKTSGWGVNNDEPHYGVGLEQADGLFQLENNGSSDGGDPYPGLANNREFNHCSVPNTTSYYGEESMVALINISDPDSTMTFDLSFTDVETGTMGAVGFGDAYAIGYLSVSMTNYVEVQTLSF
ncbi:MAG TPA: M6 family metalloprotease domain-containing protein, partial [Candidatus Marinimicrobia bacterium]|nr:M6 family metalloprotease domain-containing protein [Candidatus Neomarinimicrobiota bacterium]